MDNNYLRTCDSPDADIVFANIHGTLLIKQVWRSSPNVVLAWTILISTNHGMAIADIEISTTSAKMFVIFINARWLWEHYHGICLPRFAIIFVIVTLLPIMAASNDNFFRVTGPLCGKFTGLRWIPVTKASNTDLWCFLWSAWINDWVNDHEAGGLRCHCDHYYITTMSLKEPILISNWCSGITIIENRQGICIAWNT